MTVLAGAAAYPLLAGAQQKLTPVIGFLNSASPGPYAPFVAAFHQGLSETGYVEGRLCRGKKRGDRISLGGGQL
jgi:putative ABC transport system substrate-binding protein